MNKIKGIFLSLVAALLLFAPTLTVHAADKVNVYLFYGKGCPHCEALMTWLDKLDDTEKAKFNLIKFEVWYNSDNSTLMENVAKYLNVDTDNLGVPFLVIGNQTSIGFSEDTSETSIQKLIDDEYNSTDRYDLSANYDLSSGTAEGDTSTMSKYTGKTTSTSSKDNVTIIAFSCIALGAIGLLVFAKIKTK